jgi:hypothetical protein
MLIIYGILTFEPSTPINENCRSTTVNIDFEMTSNREEKTSNRPVLTQPEREGFQIALTRLVTMIPNEIRKRPFVEESQALIDRDTCSGSISIILQLDLTCTKYDVILVGDIKFVFISEKSRNEYIQKIKNVLMSFYHLNQ